MTCGNLMTKLNKMEHVLCDSGWLCYWHFHIEHSIVKHEMSKILYMIYTLAALTVMVLDLLGTYMYIQRNSPASNGNSIIIEMSLALKLKNDEIVGLNTSTPSTPIGLILPLSTL